MITDVTAVFNVHTEGRLLVPGLRSFREAVKWAQGCGYTVEPFIIADKPDVATLEACRLTYPEIEVVVVGNGDLGASRNDAVKLAHGQYVTFLDADDLWCRTWISECMNYAESKDRWPGWFVAHPQWWMGFDNQNTQMLLVEHVGSFDKRFNPDNLVQNNPWTALCFAPRAAFEAHRYQRRQPGIGFEDWQFNLTTLKGGVPHVSIPNTVHFVRSSTNSSRISLSMAIRNEGGVVGPHPFYARRPVFDRAAIQPYVQSVPDYKWLADCLKEANRLEPRLWPQSKPLVTWPLPQPRCAPAFWDLQDLGASRAAIQVWVPKARPSKVLTEAIAAAKAMKTADEALAFIITDTDCAHASPEEAIVIQELGEFGEVVPWKQYAGNLTAREQIFLAQKFVVQNGPRAVISVDDDIMTPVFRINMKAISASAQTFLYCGQLRDIEHRLWSPALEHLPDIYDELTAVFAETPELAHQLRRTYGFPDDGHLQSV